jgi:ribonucleotide monophosphatase NagD (HAD superfamily)
MDVNGKGTVRMGTRQLLLFDVDGVLVERGGTRRLPGAAEAMAQLRHSGDAVLSLLTEQDEDSARRRITLVGVDRYLDLTVAGYAGAPVATVVRRARAAYGGFTVVVVTADAARAPRADVDIVIAVATDASASRPAGADDVVTNLVDLVALVGTAPRASAPTAAAGQ